MFLRPVCFHALFHLAHIPFQLPACHLYPIPAVSTVKTASSNRISLISFSSQPRNPVPATWELASPLLSFFTPVSCRKSPRLLQPLLRHGRLPQYTRVLPSRNLYRGVTCLCTGRSRYRRGRNNDGGFEGGSAGGNSIFCSFGPDPFACDGW